MASCRRRRPAALAVLAAVLPGCVSGHLLDAARRRERPIAVTAAAVDGDRLVIRYTAEVQNDAGDRLGSADGAAAIPLATLRATQSPAADAVSPSWLSLSGAVGGGVPVTIERAGHGGAGATCAGPVLEVIAKDGRDTALVWRDPPGAPPYAPVPLAALTRSRTAPWAWPLMPPMLAVDAVLTPVLVILAPSVMVLGE
jgi:hypothetical protein